MNDAQYLNAVLDTAEVQVTIVATVTVPRQRGTWTQDDVINAAAWAARNGRADVEAHQVEATGAPSVPGTADELTAWTPPARRRG